MFKSFLPLLAVILLIGFATRAQAQSCNGSLSGIAIDGSSSGLPLSCTAVVTSNYNGAQISCFPGQGTSNNGQATVTPAGGTSGYTYLWSDGAAQTTAVATGLTAGTYTVIVTDASACTTVCTVTLTGPAEIVGGTCSYVQDGCQLSAGQIRVEATGGTGTLNASWTAVCSNPPGPQGPGGPNPVPHTFTGLAGQCTYSFTVTDANGCIDN